MSTTEVERTHESIIELIDQIKVKFTDPIILVGGDFNKKPMRSLITAVPELKPIKAGATRKGVALDEIYCNIDRCIEQKEILRPLCTEQGTESDHLIIAAAAKLPRRSRITKNTFSFRPLTKKGTERFKSLLLETEWGNIKLETSSQSANALTVLLDSYIEKCSRKRQEE